MAGHPPSPVGRDRLARPRLRAFALDYLAVSLYLALLAGAFALLRGVGVDPFGALTTAAGRQALGVAVLTLPVILVFALPEGLGRRASLGKRRVGLTLIGPGGAPLGLGRSLLRSLIKFAPWELAHTAVWRLPERPDDPLLIALAIGGMALALLYAATLFVGDGRTPYDRLAGSRVVRA